MTTEKIYGPWIKWHGGECTVPPETMVQVRFRDGTVKPIRPANTYRWRHIDDYGDIVEKFPILKQRLSQLAGTLSGGEQQMLAISRALMSSPRVLLLDEPSLGLAPMIVETLMETILKIRDEGMTVLLVEQNAAQALDISDRGYIMETGRIVKSGTGRELSDDPDIRRVYLGG